MAQRESAFAQSRENHNPWICNFPRDEWPDPKLWWPRSPHLYQLRTRLKVADGAHTDQLDMRFAFREFASTGKHFLLNGHIYKPVYLGDVERHRWIDQQALAGKVARLLANQVPIIRTHGFAGQIASADTRFDVTDEAGQVIILEAFSASGFGTMHKFAFSDDRFRSNSRAFYAQRWTHRTNRIRKYKAPLSIPLLQHS